MNYPLLPVAKHGGPQGDAEHLLDFSVNTNPLGPNPALVALWQATDLSAYPDPAYRKARYALAEAHGFAPTGVVLGVGASELLHRIVRALLPVGGRVAVLGAPFGEFARAVVLQRAQQQTLPRTLAALQTAQADLIYLSNPHSPSGDYLDLRCVDFAALAAPVIVDEAYLPFLAEGWALPCQPNLIRLCSPGKAHGLLGARLAYALCDAPLAAHLNNLQPAWALPSASAALLAALPEQGKFLAQTLPQVRSWAQQLAQALGAAPTGLHFFTAEVRDASAVAAALLQQGIQVRDCTSFGAPDRVRIATRLPSENQQLLAAWQTIRNEATQ